MELPDYFLPDNKEGDTKVRQGLPDLQEANDAVGQRELGHVLIGLQDTWGQLGRARKGSVWVTLLTNSMCSHICLTPYLFDLVLLVVSWGHQAVGVDALVSLRIVAIGVGLLHGQEGADALHLTLVGAVCQTRPFRGQTAGRHPFGILLFLMDTVERRFGEKIWRERY